MQHRIIHRTVWLLIAGAILADLSLLAQAQYPSTSDNRVGVAPMAPVAMPSTPQYDTYGIVPQSPYAPQTTMRPANWVGGAPPAAAPENSNLLQQNYPSTAQFVPPFGTPQLNPGTMILARVGSEGILACEILPNVERALAEAKNKMPPEEFELYHETYREMLIKKFLKQQIESRLVYQDVKRDIPAEGMSAVNRDLTKHFEGVELPRMMEQEKATTTKELDEKLKVYGTSLAQEKKAFFEKMLVGEWVRRQIKKDEMPTVIQMTNYYDAHKADFTTQAKARWEELTVSKAKYATKEEAIAAIGAMGNRVLVSGEPFAEVAKQSSDGFTAMKGGYRDWVSKGSLKDTEIEAAVFGPTLPVGQMSQIIETKTDYNIIRVIERVDQMTEDFLVAQDTIRKKIIEERTDRQFREYLGRLERLTPIWTVYDGDGGNVSLAERLTDKRR